MTTLLLRPPPRRQGSRGLLVPPLGLAYLAAVLLERGQRVELLDAWAEGLSWDETARRVRALRPDVVGLSAMTPVADVAYHAAELVRPYTRHVVLGGPHPTAVGAKALEDCPALDALVLGEGENSLPTWVDALAAGPNPAPTAGILTRDGQGPPAEAPDLDTLPLPARHLLPNHRYHYPLASRAPLTTMVTSRGCPFHCSFCDQAVTGHRFRARSPESVVDELVWLEAHGFKYVCLYDDVFTLDRRRVLAICDGIRRRGVKIDWKCEARVDCVDATMLAEMAAAGCRTIAFGLETANQVGLDALRKDSTVEDARRAFTLARRHGIETLAYVLFGIPGETPADALRTLAFCDEVGVSWVQFATLAPTPGTELHQRAEAEGWPTADVRGPFDDDLARPAVLAPGWSEADLRRLMTYAVRRYYLAPRFLARQAWRGLTGGQLLASLKGGARHARSTLKVVRGTL